MLTFNSRTRLEFLFGTENIGFCALMKIFFSSIAIATVLKNSKIKVQNVKFAGKRKTQDEFVQQGRSFLQTYKVSRQKGGQVATLPVRQAGLQVEPTKKAPTCKVSLPREAPTRKVSLPKEAPTRKVSLPKEAPTCKVSLPREAPTRKVSLPREAPTRKVSLPKKAPTCKVSLPREAPTRKVSLPKEVSL